MQIQEEQPPLKSDSLSSTFLQRYLAIPNKTILKTYLHYICRYGNDISLDLLNFDQLLRAGNTTENEEKSIPLHLIFWKYKLKRPDSLKLAQKLIDANPQIINAIDEDGSTPLIYAATLYHNTEQNITPFILESDKCVWFLLLNQADISILPKQDTPDGKSLHNNLYNGCSQNMKDLIQLMKTNKTQTLPNIYLTSFQNNKEYTISTIQNSSETCIQEYISQCILTLKQEQDQKLKQELQSHTIQKEIMKIITNIQKNRDNSFFSCMFKPNIKKSLIDLMNQALANGPIETTIFEKNLAKLFENTGYLKTHSTLSKKFKEYHPKNIDLMNYLQLPGKKSQAKLRARFNVTQEYKRLKDTKNTEHKTYFQKLI